MTAVSRRAALGAAALPIAGATAATVQPCPAEAIARQLAVAAERTRAADEAGWSIGDGEFACRFDALQAETFRLYDALADVQALGAAGACAQIMAAHSIACDGLPAALGAKFDGLLLSAVAALEALSGVRREDVGGAFLMPRYVNAMRDDDDDRSPEPELTALAATVAEGMAAFAAKGGDDAAEFETLTEEAAHYAELELAFAAADEMCDLRGLTVVGCTLKAKAARQFFGIGNDEVGHNLARSACRDLEQGLIPYFGLVRHWQANRFRDGSTVQV